MKMRLRLLTIVFLSMISITVWAKQVAEVSVDRAWGLLIGDEVTLQVELPVESSEIDRSSLPEKEARYGTWLYLKDRELKGNILRLIYQVVNVPIENTEVFIPEFNLRQLNDQWITVPSVPLIIGSALVKESNNIMAKPDHSPILIETKSIKNKLLLFSIITVIASLLWLVWHIGWRPVHRKPFAQATYELSHIKWLNKKQENQAARILHSAFNRTANTVVVVADLDELFQHAPWLQDLETDISAFYQRSAQYFFAQNTEQVLDIDSIIKLAKACRSREKLV